MLFISFSYALIEHQSFTVQWILVKTRAPTSMQKTCLFTLITQLFSERYGDDYYMDLALWLFLYPFYH